MILKTMWGKRANCARPELMVAWDEHCVDDNAPGFTAECEQERAAWGSDLAEWRLIDITVPEYAIRQAFEVVAASGSVAPPA